MPIVKENIVFNSDGSRHTSTSDYYNNQAPDNVVVSLRGDIPEDIPVVAKGKYIIHNVSLYRIPQSKLESYDWNREQYSLYVRKSSIDDAIAHKKIKDTYFTEDFLLGVDYDITLNDVPLEIRKYTLVSEKDLKSHFFKEMLETLPKVSTLKELLLLKKLIEVILENPDSDKMVIHRHKKTDEYTLHYSYFKNFRLSKKLSSTQYNNIKHLKIKETLV